MVDSITPKLNNPSQAKDLLLKIRRILRSKDNSNNKLSEFAKEVLTRTIRNSQAHDDNNRGCMLTELQNIFTSHSQNGPDPASHAVATALQKLLFELRDASSATEHADAS